MLLLSANFIVFVFLSFFIFKLSASQNSTDIAVELKINSVPKIIGESSLDGMTALSYVVYDPETRTTIASKNPNLRLSPASSIKILTALVALEKYNLTDYLRSQPASFDESKMGLYLGEEIRVEDLIYGLLLASGNDAAKTIAGSYPGGAEGFIEAMNYKAQEMGLSQSNFVDPSGYQDANYSTAFEMARLASFAMENETIRRTVGTAEKVVYDKNFTAVHILNNLNELLSVKNVTGIKTGFTNEAGGVLITSYMHLGHELIIVVMKSEDRFLDTRQIINYIDSSIFYSDIGSSI